MRWANRCTASVDTMGVECVDGLEMASSSLNWYVFKFALSRSNQPSPHLIHYPPPPLLYSPLTALRSPQRTPPRRPSGISSYSLPHHFSLLTSNMSSAFTTSAGPSASTYKPIEGESNAKFPPYSSGQAQVSFSFRSKDRLQTNAGMWQQGASFPMPTDMHLSPAHTSLSTVPPAPSQDRDYASKSLLPPAGYEQEHMGDEQGQALIQVCG